mmetsp:Transcript_2753/g.5018  ORF Transcript_2753/g.5018 Transcript_2753/m.5018 type:complete len:357 (-) Transcript_2753:356-1426(-)
MPELPEVERAGKLLRQHLVGKRVCHVSAEDDNLIFVGTGTKEAFCSLLREHSVVSVVRKGKHLALELENGSDQICLHFGMTGAFRVRGIPAICYQTMRSGTKGETDPSSVESDLGEHSIENGKSQSWPPRFTKFEITAEDGTQVAFIDPRRLARVRVVQDRENEPFWNQLGPDAMNELPDEHSFHSLLSAKGSTPIKSLLLDQSCLSGIGNWMADEILFHSRIHPEQRTNLLSYDDTKRIRHSIETIITGAVSIDSGDVDSYPEEWLFHHRWGRKSNAKLADGSAVKFVTVGSRTSAYVPRYQKLRRVGGSVNVPLTSEKMSPHQKPKQRGNLRRSIESSSPEPFDDDETPGSQCR